MRIRSIKPEMRSDEVVCSWSFRTRWTFVGLISYVDDDGRGRDDPRLVKAALYPLDDTVTPRLIETDLKQIAENGPLCRYEVEGKRYLHLINFSLHQRVNRRTDSLMPPCHVHDKDVRAHHPLTEPSVSPPRARSEVVHREQGTGKGTGNRDVAPAAPPREPDELFDALIAAVGWEQKSLTSSARGNMNQALKQLREVHATPNQIKVRARRFQQRYESATLTPSALAKHWASLSQSNAPDERPPGWEFGMGGDRWPGETSA